MSNIQDKVVIITGASSGIGEATAKELASKGAKLVLAARREERLKKLQEEIQNSGGQAIYQVTDVTSYEQMEALAELALKEFGKSRRRTVTHPRRTWNRLCSVQPAG